MAWVLSWVIFVGTALGELPVVKPLIVTPESGMVSAVPYCLFARDVGGRTGVRDVDALEWFAFEGVDGGVPAFGYSQDAVWMRLRLENPSARDSSVLVELPISRLDEVRWFVLDGDRVVEEVADGLRLREAGTEHTRYPVVSVLLPAGASRWVFLRVQSNSSVWVPVRAGTALSYVAYAARRNFRDFTFVGLGLAMFLVALLYGLVQRERLYLLLSLLAAGFMVYYLIFNGFYHWLGGPWQPWVNRQMLLSWGMLGHWAFYQFTLVYVQRQARECPPLRVLNWISRLLLAGVVVLGVLPFRMGVLVLLALLLVCFLSGTVASLRQGLYSRGWIDRLLAGIWLLVLVVVAILYAQFLGWIPYMLMPTYLQHALLPFIYSVFLAIVMVQHRQAVREQERARASEQSAIEAQLQALRYQLNPHFLFNTLNSIDALARQAPQRIPELVRKLAAFLRLRIEPAPDGLVSLEEELESIRIYLDIEKVRFEESLQVRYEVDAETLRCEVPEMLLQPLVENAVRYGMPPEGALEVRIGARRQAGELHLRIVNNGSLVEPGERGGIGTGSLKERLGYIYGAAASFTLNESDGLVTAEIRMPAREVAV